MKINRFAITLVLATALVGCGSSQQDRNQAVAASDAAYTAQSQADAAATLTRATKLTTGVVRAITNRLYQKTDLAAADSAESTDAILHNLSEFRAHVSCASVRARVALDNLASNDACRC